MDEKKALEIGDRGVTLKAVFQVLPISIRELMQALPASILDSLEEIRIRQERPLEVITDKCSWFVNTGGRLSKDARQGKICCHDDCRKILNLVSRHSLYAMEEELRQGYVTIEGGHRIGLVGKVVTEKGRVRHLQEITGFNIRIARQLIGVASNIYPLLWKDNRFHHLLIISPPQCGKTTMLRDLARLVSNGSGAIPSQKVGIVDERSEIAGCLKGVAQHDVGIRTDVLDACPKAEGMMMLIRSMSPQVLIVDEIGRSEDAEAINEAVCAGVTIFATAHGKNLAEVARRPYLRELIEEKLFGRYLLLSRKNGTGTIEGLYDQDGHKLSLKEVSPC